MIKDISVVLPAYNEEKNITTAVISVNDYLRKKFRSYEIIVVDDGSSDTTAAVVQRLSKKIKNLKLVTHSKNKGYGAALRSGFAAGRGKLIFYTDADNQYRIQELDNLLPYSRNYAIVAGYRLNHDDPLTRVIISHIYNLLIRLLFGLKIRDIDCSFKLYRQEVFKKIKLRCNTGLIDAEVLIKAQKNGFEVYQLGVQHYPRTQGQSIYEIGKRNKIIALVNPAVPIKIFKEIKKYWRELH